MKAKINIAEILESKSQGTKLYSLTYGDCFYQEYTGDFGIECQNQNGVQFNLDEYGKYCIDGECIIFLQRKCVTGASSSRRETCWLIKTEMYMLSLKDLPMIHIALS